MTFTNYATDSYSNLAGMSAVAYSDPDYFREVKNQIFQQSPTRGFDPNLPSSLIMGLFGQGDQIKQTISSSLISVGSEPGTAKDWFDANKHLFGGEDTWVSNLSGIIETELLNSLDNNQGYYRSLEDYISASVDILPAFIEPIITQKIAYSLRLNVSVGEDLDEMISVVNNNPFTKIDSVPPDTVIPLQNSVDLGVNYNGASIQSGFLSLANYFSGVSYPRLTSDVSNLPSGLSSSVSNGYVGYAPYSLDSLFNPLSSNLIPYMGSNNMPEALSEILAKNNPILSTTDRDVYNISLMSLDLAGNTSYDPTKNSNGDFLDISLLPKFFETNTDPGGGNLFSARDTGAAFT